MKHREQSQNAVRLLPSRVRKSIRDASSSGRSARANAIPHAHALDGAEEGDEIEIRVGKKWWCAKVIEKRKRDKQQPTELKYCWRTTTGYSPRANGRWISVSAPNLRVPTIEDNQWAHHTASLEHATGYITEDQWTVESILDAREEGDGQMHYFVHWSGWAHSYDSWEPAGAILDDELIVEFEERCNAARLAAEQTKQAERDLFARFSKDAIDRVRCVDQ